MRVLVRLPDKISDAVLATPALDNLVRHFRGAGITLVGSPPVAEVFASDTRFEAVVPDVDRHVRLRFVQGARLARRINADHGPFEYGFAFPSTFASRWLLYAAGVWRRAGQKTGMADLLLNETIACEGGIHPAETYNQLVNRTLQTHYETGPTHLVKTQPRIFARRTLGIHPGPDDGTDRHWPAARFAEVAAALADRFEIVISGGPETRQTAAEIAAQLQQRGLQHYQNTAGQTTLDEWLRLLGGLDLLLTHDGGAMHVGSALGIPVIAIAGGVDPRRASPWGHDRVRILAASDGLECEEQQPFAREHRAAACEIALPQVIEAAKQMVDTRPVKAAG